MDYIGVISTQMGIPIWTLSIIVIWTLVWKLLALWKSARNGSVAWFIILAVINTLGILPILYIFVFSKINWRGLEMPAKKKPAKKAAKKKKKK